MVFTSKFLSKDGWSQDGKGQAQDGGELHRGVVLGFDVGFEGFVRSFESFVRL